MTLSLGFEILVSILLVITIGYCFILDRRLKALRSGQDGVRQSIQDLVQVSLSAEQSVHRLAKTSEQVTEELQASIIEAKALTGKLPAGMLKARGKTGQDRILPLNEAAEDTQSTGLMDRLKRAI
ncbi:MAG: DUF6468 domain-containing protein [Robiginitomaculum sp.]|nr:DUF6468 domain-containing protein [Robiginitomaculum sp.]